MKEIFSRPLKRKEDGRDIASVKPRDSEESENETDAVEVTRGDAIEGELRLYKR